VLLTATPGHVLMLYGQRRVVSGGVFQNETVVVVEFPYDLAGHPRPQSVWWNDLAGRDECARRHQGTRAHTSTTEDGCPDPDEGTFLHDRAVHHGLVSQAHIVVQDRGLTGIGVHTALVLDVDLVPDHDFLTVGPQHSAVPDTALGADAYAADRDRTRCDPCGGIDLRGPEGSTADVRPRRVGNQVLCCAVHVALSTVLTGVSVIS